MMNVESLSQNIDDAQQYWYLLESRFLSGSAPAQATWHLSVVDGFDDEIDMKVFGSGKT